MKIKQYLSFFVLPVMTVFFLNLTGCMPQKNIILDSENVCFSNLHKSPSKGIMVITDEREGQIWFRTEKESKIAIIPNVPQTSLYDVWQIQISPDDRFMAVLSAGEGHPEIDIFELKNILKQEYTNDNEAEPVLSINPYPGSVWIKEWKNEKTLIIESDMPLDSYYDKNIEFFMLEPKSKSFEFLFDVDKVKITRK